MSETTSYKRMPNINLPETENIKLVWTHQEKRRRLPFKKNNEHQYMVIPVKRIRGRPILRWIDNSREDLNKYELTADKTENRLYWKMMVKTDPQRCGDGL